MDYTKPDGQMRAQDRVSMRMSREETVEDNEALLKAGIDGLVHEASIGIWRGFG